MLETTHRAWSGTGTKARLVLLLLAVALVAANLPAQGFGSTPVFHLSLVADRTPLTAGGSYRLALKVSIDPGWHINSNAPGSTFAVPTTLVWKLPGGWAAPSVSWPPAQHVRFSFSATPLDVWEHSVVILASGAVPASASGDVTLQATLTAQACNNAQCLPPTPVTASLRVTIAPAGSPVTNIHAELFPGSKSSSTATSSRNAGPSQGASTAASKLAGVGLPLQLLIVFLAGLALNLTPCVYPLIPITVGFFTQEAKGRQGGTFLLALVYVLGMSVTYSVLGVAAALTGQLFGSALQSPIVIGVIVVVLLALALSMFGLWELRVPGWAMRASGGRSGFIGAALMGLLVGFVAAPCIGPFVLGLLTYVGQVGSPVLGFVLFFALAMGLGVPYLLLGTFTGALNKMPASGAWMVGVRKVFGVILIAMAVYFLKPVLPHTISAWLMALTLILGALYMLVIERTAHEQPTIDRVMRLLAAILLAAGVLQIPHSTGLPQTDALTWQTFNPTSVKSAIASGRPVIIDFYADWCAPCHELEDKTFADPRVAAKLKEYARFKVNMTKRTGENQKLAAMYGVRGVPTIILYANGKETARLTGFEPPERFLPRLNQ